MNKLVQIGDSYQRISETKKAKKKAEEGTGLETLKVDQMSLAEKDSTEAENEQQVNLKVDQISLAEEDSTAAGNEQQVNLKVDQISLAEKDSTGAGDEQQVNKSDKQKIDVLLKATGNAPIMKKKKWAVDQEKRIGGVIEFIKKYLRLDPSENLFLYVNQAFAPSPDQTIKNLYECFGADGKLVLHYCRSQAWG